MLVCSRPGSGFRRIPRPGAVALVGFLQLLQQCRHGRRRWTVQQGLQIGRPSKLLLDAEFADGGIVTIKLGLRPERSVLRKAIQRAARMS